MSVAEVAEQLAVSGTRVRKLCQDGILKARKIGARVYLVDAKSVEEYKASDSRKFRPLTPSLGQFANKPIQNPPKKQKKK